MSAWQTSSLARWHLIPSNTFSRQGAQATDRQTVLWVVISVAITTMLAAVPPEYTHPHCACLKSAELSHSASGYIHQWFRQLGS